MNTPHQRQARLRLDWEVVGQMTGEIFDAAAYASIADLGRQSNPITSIDRAGLATAYLVDFYVPTLVGPGPMADVTTISVDLNVADYPYAEPATALVSRHVPYSPHFRAGMPVCIGEIWREHGGRMLLGSLLVHIARLLNWDEQLRGGGYTGWNADAIAYHRANYGTRALNPELRYPPLPTQLTHGTSPAPEVLFGSRRVPPGNTPLFAAQRLR